MKVQLNDIMQSIIKGLLNGNEDQVIGNMLIKTEHTIGDLITNDEASFTKIYDFLTPTAFSVLSELKQQLGSELVLLDEDGNEVDEQDL